VRRRDNIGVLFSGGGARAAYQAGVLSALSEILPEQTQPFDYITGISAGAINASYLAAAGHDFPQAARQMSTMWQQLTTKDIFDVTVRATLTNGLRWLWDIATGAAGGSKMRSLLDSSPLAAFLESHIPFQTIQQNIENKNLRALGITATSYYNLHSVTFMHSHPDVPIWDRSFRYAKRAHIDVRHVLASSSLPFLFKPIPIEGQYFGDGTLRNTTALSPVIRMGAERIVMIGVTPPPDKIKFYKRTKPSLARIFGLVLNAALLDSIDMDMERMARVNFLANYAQKNGDRFESKKIESLYLRPSRDLAQISMQYQKSMPSLLRFLLSGLGSSKEASDLLSYLNFESPFCSALITLGFEDTMARKEEILQFFYES
jgi:NTE family protein